MSEKSAQKSEEAVRARGGSMWPFIPSGSRLEVRRVPAGEIREGDVVCYLGGAGGTVAHRVVGREGGGDSAVFLARGDASSGDAERVPAGAVLYVVSRVVHPLVSYDTDGPAGRALARVALARAPGRVAAPALGAAMDALALISRQVRRAESFLGGLALGALDAGALRAMTVRAYAAGGSRGGRALFEWEREWFGADLPPAKARLLVGGAGAGRELGHLASMGYGIVAFDPVPALVERARAELGGSCLAVLEGAYEDLADRESALAGAVARFAPFDAALLGWGSLSHVVTAAHRRGLLVALRRLCPTGPVLASFWMRDDEEPVPQGRAARLGRGIGALLSGRGRGGPGPAPGDMVLPHCGFGHAFTRGELEALAAEAGYAIARLETGEAEYPRATLVPSA